MAANDAVSCFIDTNVWLYAFVESQDARKTRTARTPIEDNTPAVSSQVINEVCVNLLKQNVLKEA